MSGDSHTWRRTLLPADDVDPDAVPKLAVAREWTGLDDPDTPDGAAWRTAEGVTVEWTEHQLYGTRLITLLADDAAVGEAAAEDVRSAVPTVEAADVLAVLAAEPAPGPVELIRAARQLAALRFIAAADGTPDPGSDAIERHAGHPNPHVRRAVRLVALGAEDAGDPGERG